MSKLWTNQFEEGRESTSRGLRIGRGVFSLCLALGLFVSAGSAWAAEIMEVRVGRHPEFTRLVFELDRAVGYRVQRTDAGADSELVISLEASSRAQNIRSSKTLIEQVDVTPNGSRSVARIRLTEDGFRLKEMILSNPPRIVLDLVSESAVANATSQASRSASSASSTAAANAERLAAKAKAKAEAAKAKLEAEAAEAARVAKAEAAAAKAKAEAEAKRVAEAAAEKARSMAAAAREAEEAAAAKLAAESQKLADSAKNAADATASATTGAIADAAEKSKEMASNAADAASGTVSDTMADVTKKAEELSFDDAVDRNTEAAEKTPRPMVVKDTTEDGGGFLTWALLGAGALVVGGGALLFARRRGDSEEVDFSDEDDDDDSVDDTATVVTGDADENPFADIAGGTETGSASVASTMTAVSETVTPFADDDGMDGEDTVIAPLPDDEKEAETVVFEGTEENNMEDMEVISRDQVNESLGGSMPPVAGVPEEFQQMMREMNARMQALEGRCDELVDARDRLERQVAAQTEELRVQRAAIARTQRAVRNLARPEDAGDEEATEPALRDPNQ